MQGTPNRLSAAFGIRSVGALLTSFYCLVAALLVFVSPALAQLNQYRFARLDISQGLSHNQVNSILKDSKGFMWFGTLSGLNRYDGYHFKVFRHDLRDTTSLVDDYVSRIWEGPERKIWVETRSGWNIYDPGTETFQRNSQQYFSKLGLPGTGVSDMIRDKQGRFWISFIGNGLAVYDPAKRTTQALKAGTANGIASNAVASIATDSKGFIWLLHSNGIVEKMDGNTQRIVFRTTQLKQASQTESPNYSFFIDDEDDLWIYIASAPRGVFYMNTKKDQVTPISLASDTWRLNTNLVNSVIQDNKGMIWIATDHGGINIIDKKAFTTRYILNSTDDDKSISQNSVNTLYKDDAGIIWAGTFKRGLNYYHEGIIQFPLYRHQAGNTNSLSYDDVNRFVEDHEGNLWIGTNGGGLIYFNRSKGSFRQYKNDPGNANSLSNDVIVSLYVDRRNRLWIGTYFGGLDCFDGKQFKHYRNKPDQPQSIADNRIWELYEDSAHQFWIGTLGGGLDRFDEKNNIFHHYRLGDPSSVRSNFIFALTDDKAGDLWIGTAFGIDVLEKKSGKIRYYNNNPADSFSLSNDNVLSLLQDSRSLMWVGTREGLNLYNKSTDKFYTYRTEDGLPANAILTLLEDNNGDLWISTPNGISHATIQYTNQSKKPVLKFQNYTERDGLQGREFNENAALKSRTGELIFGGPNGFNVINPGELAHNQQIPVVVLTDFQIFDKSVRVGDEINKRIILHQSISEAKQIVLKYDENVFSLEFAALSYTDPEKNRYKYKLEGFNKDWLEADGKQRKATYTNLDPGDYVFRVKASNDDGYWNEDGIALRVKILPPFWKTPPAFVLYALIAAGILWFARRLTIQRTRMRFRLEEQQKEADRIHELDMLKLKFFTNVSHEFRTPLSLIITPLEKIIKQTEDPSAKKQFQVIFRNAKRLLGLVNQLLDFRKLEMQELRLYTSTGDIIHFIKEIVSSFVDIAERKNIHFTFHASVDSLEANFDPDKLERILFNLLSNAFKFTHENGTVSVTVEQTTIHAEPFVEISVKDSGIGIPKEKQDKIFERYFQHDVPGSLLNQGSGIGLAITREFVRLHNGTIRVESGTDHGTCFIVSLPLKAPFAAPIAPPHPEEELVLNAAHEAEHDKEAMNGKPGRKKASILVVEDNDDILFYIKDNLRHAYNVYDAVNGKEAWRKAQELQPDLVVSDVMMPEMDGLELCRKIKNDTRTSHIPVILLTARTADEQKLEGYDSGANDYIVKPFSFEILQSRIRNLLLHQEALRKLFNKQIEVNPSEIAVTSLDEQFIRQALEIVEKHIAEPEFSVEDLSKALCMSRVALYKKLLSLTGKTPLDFIRSMRMKRAAQLLEKSQLTIAEIAYQVGFNDPKYFAKFFKKEFGMLPSERRNAKR
jgi:signal transduction histidine kinase/ligand-binding sensor domain-containing protein/DNA-binding response OmpR family regulator